MAEEEKKVEETVKQEREVPPGLLLRSAPYKESRPDEKGAYGFKGGVLAFVDWEGVLYVTPGTRIKMDLLEDSGFMKRQPKIEVPFSDGQAKSKRWLRKHLPSQEIKRSVEENTMPKQDVKVLMAIKQVNRDGLKSVDDEFIENRCARVKGKNFNYIGLIGSFQGILTFTDWEANNYVTPHSEEKLKLLEKSGYIYVESMIKVPYALEGYENREWLANNIPYQEWDQTAKEVEEEHSRQAMEEAKAKIEELGLKELPDELLISSAECEEKYPQYIGMVGCHNGVLSFTDPAGVTYVSPAMQDKVEFLKSLGYQFMGAAIKVPYSLKTPEETNWLRANIDIKYWDAAKEAALQEQERLAAEETEKIKRKLALGDLPAEFLLCTIKTEHTLPHFPGKYFVRNKILAFVDSAGYVYITPVLKSKLEILDQANYKEAPTGFPVPYSDGTEEDLEFIRRNLSQQELDLTREEFAAETTKAHEEDVKKITEKLGLQELPDELIERSAVTEFEDVQLIGRYCSRQGITCFVREDGFFYVTPTVPWKEKALRDAGYKEPEQLIRVPYASDTEEDRYWLEVNLPAGEFENSSRELKDIEGRKEQERLKKLIEERGIDENLPEELAERSAITEKVDKEQIGRYIIQDDFLGFVDPDGYLWITPNTPAKVKVLKKANYQYVSTRISVPHAEDQPEDITWREINLPKGEEERSREEIEALENEILGKKAAELIAQREIKPLPESFIERCLKTETVDVEMVGRYLERFGMVYLIAPDRFLYLTPSAPSKLLIIKEAGYQFPEKVSPLPYFSEDEANLEWIRNNLPEGELERCQKEEYDLEKAKLDKELEKKMEKHGLTEVPDSILERSADTAHRDPQNIGRLGIFRGVLAFVLPDDRTLVTWFTEEKQEILEECGYKLEGYMPIKVPYAIAEAVQRQWLLENLPEADEEEELSVEENAE
jgi:hypothetical protein